MSAEKDMNKCHAIKKNKESIFFCIHKDKIKPNLQP